MARSLARFGAPRRPPPECGGAQQCCGTVWSHPSGRAARLGSDHAAYSRGHDLSPEPPAVHRRRPASTSRSSASGCGRCRTPRSTPPSPPPSRSATEHRHRPPLRQRGGRRPGARGDRRPRDELFVTTKVWNDDQGFDSTLAAFDASMGRLGLDVLDLYLIHWPTPEQDNYVDTWKALLELREEGRVRAVGVCNFHVDAPPAPPGRDRRAPRHQPGRAAPVLPAAGAARVPRRERHPHRGLEPAGLRGAVLPTRRRRDRRASTESPRRRRSCAGTRRSATSSSPSRSPRAGSRENFDIFGFELDDDDLAAIEKLDRGERTGPTRDEFNWAHCRARCRAVRRALASCMVHGCRGSPAEGARRHPCVWL